MKSIVEKIEDSIGNIVFYATLHAEYYERYVTEAEKCKIIEDNDYVSRLFRDAKRNARYSVEAAEHAGLDPEKVTKACWDFLVIFNVQSQKRKGAA